MEARSLAPDICKIQILRPLAQHIRNYSINSSSLIFLLACRAPLGMSYFMLRGTSPPSIEPVLSIHCNVLSLNRYYEHYNLKPYAFLSTYIDPNYHYQFNQMMINDRSFAEYVSWAEIKFRKYLAKLINRKLVSRNSMEFDVDKPFFFNH